MGAKDKKNVGKAVVPSGGPKPSAVNHPPNGNAGGGRAASERGKRGC